MPKELRLEPIWLKLKLRTIKLCNGSLLSHFGGGSGNPFGQLR